MKIKIGINGMGRIGRMILRSIYEGNKKIEIMHINNRTNSETCSTLLKYDSIHGKFKADISFNEKNLIVNNSRISFGQETDLNKIDWKNFDVDYVLFHQIINDSSRFLLEGQMFNTRSGGLIHRRIVDITNYYRGQVNEIKLWVGEVFKEIDEDWEEYRKLVLFEDPDAIVMEKTPQGAMARSFMVPGWGQFYSDEYNSGVMFSGIEATLLSAVLVSYLSYSKSVKGLQTYRKKYEESSEQVEFDNYRNLAEREWKKHKVHNSAMIYSGIAAGSLWIVNGIHAYIVGPRPKKDIIQKWDIVNPNPN